MASGGTQLVHNTRERILSGDHNREQQLAAQTLSELLRYLLDASNNLDAYGGGFEAMGAGNETPLRAVIINGIRPRPEIGTANLFIEGGAALLVDTLDPGPDDSKAAHVIDPGVLVAGVLTLTPGSGGATRIDVIECQRITSVLEQDNRDIFNPSTGLFTPVQVAKVQAARLTYRIRQGTPGNGFPGLAAGWLPLAVCRVPSSATTWDDVDLWDVRPLASDRVNGPFNSPVDVTRYPRTVVYSDPTDPAHLYIHGQAEATFGGYRAGGQLLTPTLGRVDLLDATAIQQSGYSFTTNKIWNLWALFPFGLPRWVRYSAAVTGQRVPRGHRGILTLSNTAAGWDGLPLTAALQTPTWYGLADPASKNGVLLLAGRVTSPAAPFGVNCDGRTCHVVNGGIDTRLPSSTTADSATWTFADEDSHPAHARAAWVRFTLEIDEPSGAARYAFGGFVVVSGPDGDISTQQTEVTIEAPSGPIYKTGVGTATVSFTARVPLAIGATVAARTFSVKWSHLLGTLGGGCTVSAISCSVFAWDVGP